MAPKLTFFVLSSSGDPIRRMTVSKAFFRFLAFLSVAAVLSMAAVVFDYVQLKRAEIQTEELGSRLDSRNELITQQRRQIQNFASEINDLKTKLLALNDFERKIRVIANIEKAPGQEGLFGVGGSIPEDLDTRLPLEQQHNSLIREMHEQAEQLEMASVNQEKGFGSLLRYLEDQRNLLASTPAVRPTSGWTTSRFGYRESPFTGLREFHKGLDVANREGTPIIATADGVVAYAAKKGLLGIVMVIDHGHGMVTRYGHISEILKKRGDRVKRGDVIATMGDTGRSTGPHLHYEVLLNGIPVNPEQYILN